MRLFRLCALAAPMIVAAGCYTPVDVCAELPEPTIREVLAARVHMGVKYREYKGEVCILYHGRWKGERFTNGGNNT